MREADDAIALLLTVEPGADPGPAVRGTCLTVPADHPPFARAFLDRWRPDACLWACGGIRAALMDATLRRAPMIVAGARAEPAVGGRLGLPSAILSRMRRVLAIDPRDAQAWRRLGAPMGRVEVAGPLQAASVPPAHDEAMRRAIAGRLAGRPVWFAVAVPDALLPAVIEAHGAILRRMHRTLLILEPASGGMPPGLDPARTVVHDPDGADDTGLEDVHEVLVTRDPEQRGLWYRVAPVTLMGDTLETDLGAAPFPADPDAPAGLGSALVHGGATGAFSRAYARLSTREASHEVTGPAEVASAVEALLSPDRAARQARAAWSVVTRGAETTDRLAALLLDAMER